jgi:CubicO group peptidase (beta-lactamase class C family)
VDEGHGAQRSRTSDDDLLDTTARVLEHRLATAQAQGRSPSMVAGVVRGGRLVWSSGRGSSDDTADGARWPDVQYRIGSITKTFVAVLVLRLRDEGRLDLGDRVEAHLPGTPVGDATVAQLLAHASGLAAETLGAWWERTPGTVRPGLDDVVDATSRRLAPGRRHHYSNPGFALLGALVERHRGVPWTEALAGEILEPLGMTRTTTMPTAPHAHGWAVHPWADVVLPEPAEDAGLMGPAGQLWSTVEDLARYAAFLLAGDDRVLPAATLEEMRAPAALGDGPEWDRAAGLGWQLLHHRRRVLVGHTGSMPGFLAVLWADPGQDLAALAFANATSGPAVGALATGLIDEVTEREPRLPEPWRPVAATTAELALTGPWYWGPAPVVVRLRPGPELLLEGLGGPARTSRFRPAGDTGTWTGLDGYYAGETLRAVRRGDGTTSHLDVAGFVLTRAPYDPADVVPGGVDPQGWRGRLSGR